MCACEHREKHSRSCIFPRQNPPLWRFIVGMWWKHQTSCFAPPKETKREEVKYLPFPTSFLQ
ncbi:hypothetical protein NC652_035067 [Populus alba x Populus x berolinensis]|uniref:Uncharacterized protein n=1 Tax=Populus alba x Populus x berolinensis TaxID=444605 RepID=A0AAD6LPB1_9ROSI|nr:hypothetical protein NC652_035067 [Populus alba x Populus x berolinensis]KAJ6970555.1 hypothetical protein NC653_034982 [Populus alba x Populus x berolinensis]